MHRREIRARGIRFSIREGGVEAGHAYLYVLTNDLHHEPFGLLEDVFVEDKFIKSGVAGQLVAEIMRAAKKEGCYKLIATSRLNTSRKLLHAWYKRLGFKDYGKEFRMDL
jgi:GNAT superfamily N-acetyltransferase